MLAHVTLLASVFDIAHLLWLATYEYLGYKAIIVESLVAWTGTFELIPVIGKDLLEDV
jgi:hypothetical protein